MRQQFLFLIVVPVFAAVLSQSIARAQCEPDWITDLGNPGIEDGYVQPMVAWDDGTGEDLYVGGSFSRIGNINAESLAKYDPDTDSWSRLGRGLASGFLTSLLPHDDGTGEKLIVGGVFSDAGGVPGTSGIAAWDGSSWSSVGGGTPQFVWALHAADLGDGETLYAGGQFDTIGDAGVGGIAAWDGVEWAAVGSGVGIDGSFSPYINHVIDFDDGNGRALYIVGRFDTVDGVDAQLIAKWDGTSWSQVGNGLIPPSALRYLDAVAIYDNGDGAALYVAGTEFRIRGVSGTYSAAKWDGTEWTPIGQNIGGRVTGIFGWDAGGGSRLHLVGTALPGVEYFAVLEGNTWATAYGGVGGTPIPPSNFPSAFGFYQWGEDLLIGGNFSEVGSDELGANGIAALRECVSCTDRERLKLVCKPGEETVRLIAKIRKGTPNASLTVRLNEDPETDRSVTLNGNGRGKTRYRRLAPGSYTGRILECDAVAQVECG